MSTDVSCCPTERRQFCGFLTQICFGRFFTDFLTVTFHILQRIFIVSYYNKLAEFIFFSLKIWSTYCTILFLPPRHFLCILLTWCHNFGLTPSAVRGIKKWDHSSCANFIQTFRTWNCFYWGKVFQLWLILFSAGSWKQIYTVIFK